MLKNIDGLPGIKPLGSHEPNPHHEDLWRIRQLGQQVLQSEDVFPRNEILADFSPSLHDSYESRSRILGEYGRGMLEPSETPSVRGLVGYVDSVRHEENARWFDGKNVVTQLYANVEESHFLTFLATSLDVPQRRLYKAIGSRGLFISADLQDPPLGDLYGHGGARHLTMTLASAANSMKRTPVHPIAYVAVNAEPSHEYADLFTGRPFSGRDNIAEVPGALEALLQDAQIVAKATVERSRKTWEPLLHQ